MDHNSVKRIWMDVLHVLTTDLLVVVIQYYKSLDKYGVASVKELKLKTYKRVFTRQDFRH